MCVCMFEVLFYSTHWVKGNFRSVKAKNQEMALCNNPLGLHAGSCADVVCIWAQWTYNMTGEWKWITHVIQQRRKRRASSSDLISIIWYRSLKAVWILYSTQRWCHSVFPTQWLWKDVYLSLVSWVAVSLFFVLLGNKSHGIRIGKGSMLMHTTDPHISLKYLGERYEHLFWW